MFKKKNSKNQIMSRGRFELPTQGFSVLCSNQLSYLDGGKYIMIIESFGCYCFLLDFVKPEILHSKNFSLGLDKKWSR